MGFLFPLNNSCFYCHFPNSIFTRVGAFHLRSAKVTLSSVKLSISHTSCFHICLSIRRFDCRWQNGVRVQATRVKEADITLTYLLTWWCVGLCQRGGLALYSSTVDGDLISMPAWVIISFEKSQWSPCRKSMYRKKKNPLNEGIDR